VRKTRRDENNKIFEDTFYHVCYGENPTGNLVSSSETGENYWSDFDTAIDAQKKNIAHGKYSLKVLDITKNKDFDFFFFHENISLKST